MHVFTQLFVSSSFLLIFFLLLLRIRDSSIHLFSKLIMLGTLGVCVLSWILLDHLFYSIYFKVLHQKHQNCDDNDNSNSNDCANERICFNFPHLPIVHRSINSINADILRANFSKGWLVDLILLEVCVIAFCGCFEDQLAYTKKVWLIVVARDVGQNDVHLTDVKPTLVGANIKISSKDQLI